MMNLVIAILIAVQPASVVSTADGVATCETTDGNIYTAYAEDTANNAVMVFGQAIVW